MTRGNLNVNFLSAIRRFNIAAKRIIESRVVGGEISIFKGRGLEFSGYRGYTTNDDAGQIDWKASARTNETLIKEYVEEKNLNVFFLIDASSKMIFGSTPKLKIEYAVEMVGALTKTILDDDNNVGFALFDEGIRLRISPSQGMKQYSLIAHELVKGDYYGGEGNDIKSALKFVMGFLEGGSILIIVSDFINCTPGWQDYLKMASNRFDVISLVVRDPMDNTLPEGVGQVVLQDPYSKRQLVIDPDVVKEMYEKLMIEQQRMLERTFMDSNVDYLILSTDKDFVKPLIGLFSTRNAKWR